MIAAAPISGYVYILPPSAADSVATTLSNYTENLVPIRIAATLMIFSAMFYTTWGMAVSLLPRRVEGDYPILFYIQVIALATSVVVVLLIGYFWGVGAFRAGETTPEITQLLNDIGWLGVLFTGAPFAVQQVALGTVTLLDKSDRPVYPRWSAYLNFFVAVFMIEAALVLFFKTGPFSQNGFFVFYVPMFVFFTWIMAFSVLAYRGADIIAERYERAL
ncbi:MAG: hypothetical protein RLN85_05910 [Pseudomonadales bacterium]